MNLRRTIILLTILLGLAIIWASCRGPETVYFDPGESMTPVPSEGMFPIIRSINERNNRIRSFECDVDMTITVKLKFKAQGYLSHQKDNFFRLVASRRRVEMDVGSNPDHFWFWSRRMDPPSLYYCRHQFLNNSGLRTAFNPLWMMESLGIGQIDMENVQCHDVRGRRVLSQSRISSRNEPVIKRTVIDLKQNLVVGHYLCDKTGALMASTEVLAFQEVQGHIVPKTIQILWHEENVSMLWQLQNVRVNHIIGPGVWRMPNKNTRVNLGTP